MTEFGTSLETLNVFLSVKKVGSSEYIRIPAKTIFPILLNMSYESEDEKLGMLKLKLDNYDLRLFDDENMNQIFQKGNELRVSFGYSGDYITIKDLVIDNVTGFQTLMVSALEKEAYTNLTEITFTRHEPSSASDIFLKIWTEKYLDIADTIVIQKSKDIITDGTKLLQIEQTDMEYFKFLGSTLSPPFVFYVRDGVAHFHPRGFSQTPRISYNWRSDPRLIDFSIKESASSNKYNSVELSGFDIVEKKFISGTGNDKETDRTNLAKMTESSSEESSVLEQIGEFIISATEGGKLKKSYGLGSRRNLRQASAEQTQDDLKRRADSEFIKQEQFQIEATLTVVGNSKLSIGTVIRLNGLSKIYSGNYFIKGLTHNINRNGFITTLNLITNGTADVPGPAALKPTTSADVNNKPVMTNERVAKTTRGGKIYFVTETNVK